MDSLLRKLSVLAGFVGMVGAVILWVNSTSRTSAGDVKAELESTLSLRDKAMVFYVNGKIDSTAATLNGKVDVVSSQTTMIVEMLRGINKKIDNIQAIKEYSMRGDCPIQSEKPYDDGSPVESTVL